MRRIYGLLVVGLLASVLSTSVALAAPGKFYIVSMGLTPDLITVRGANVIKSADIVLLEEPGDQEAWSSFIGDKEIIFCPHRSRIFYGVDIDKLTDPDAKKQAQENAKTRQDAVDKVAAAVRAGKSVVAMEWGDAMMYGTTFYLEMLPKDIPTEVVPGVGAFECAVAAVKYSPSFGWDTNSVVLTMSDWKNRTDTNRRLMRLQTSLVVYTMHLDYQQFFADLKEFYPANTPVAVVCFAGDPEKQEVIRSTVGRFLDEVKYEQLPPDMHTLLVGKFLICGQARNDGLMSSAGWINEMHPAESMTPGPQQ